MPSSAPDLLQQLRDIHEPLAPGWWPPAIGWWILSLLVLVALVSAVLFLISHNRKRRPYKRIRRAVEALNARLLNNEIDAMGYATRINLLFKELVTQVEGRVEAAQLHGSAWLDFLADYFEEPEFVSGAGKFLGSARYMPESFSAVGLQALTKKTLLKRSYRQKPHDA